MFTEALLPLVTYPDASNASAAPNAARIAYQLGARLHALALEIDIPVISNALSGALVDVDKLIRDTEAMSRQRGTQLLRMVEESARDIGVDFETETISLIEPEFGNAVTTVARYHDVSLIGWEPTNRTLRVIAEALIFDSGRPVVLLPETVPDAIDHVAFAWDGSRVAARAVGDALALFRNATKATVILVTDEKIIPDTKSADRLAAYLERRGLQAKAHYATSGGRRIGETLQAEAKAVGADVLVMGAYGHSRLRQFILGGATKGILDELKLPVLLSH